MDRKNSSCGSTLKKFHLTSTTNRHQRWQIYLPPQSVRVLQSIYINNPSTTLKCKIHVTHTIEQLHRLEMFPTYTDEIIQYSAQNDDVGN